MAATHASAPSSADADIKFFVTASLEARPPRTRRLQDYGVRSITNRYDDLVERDARDATRNVAPMKPAEDAIVIDTSELTMNEVYERALRLIASRV